MNENWVLALSNLAALLPLAVVLRAGDLLTFLVLLNVALASFFSHLFECHKHGMPGNGLSPRASYLLNRWDVVGCVLIMGRVVQKYLFTYGLAFEPLVSGGGCVYLFAAMVGFACLRISEYDKYNACRKLCYIRFHVAWHIIIFVTTAGYYHELFG